jgi:hypothetical protein
VATPNAAGWYTAESAECGFTIWFPTPYSISVGSGVADDGVKTSSWVFAAMTETGCTFTANCIVKEGAAVPADFAERIAATFASSGSLMSRAPRETGGVDGLHLAIEQQDSTGVVRLLVANGNAYQLIVQCPQAEAEAMAELGRTFFDSFSLEPAQLEADGG